MARFSLLDGFPPDAEARDRARWERVRLSLTPCLLPCPRKTYPLLSGSMQARKTEMTKTVRTRYTLEFKEAVRLVHGGQSIAAAARTLGVVEQTLFNWVKADRLGKLTGADSKAVSAEQMEISRLRAELARVKMERDILGKATASFAKRRAEVRLHSPQPPGVADLCAVPSPAGQHHRLPRKFCSYIQPIPAEPFTQHPPP